MIEKFHTQEKQFHMLPEQPAIYKYSYFLFLDAEVLLFLRSPLTALLESFLFLRIGRHY